MKNLKQKLGPIWSAALLVCLTIVLVSAATATAATIINGKNIKKGTITGNKLKKNTVTGTYIKESSLKTVPKATAADSATTAGDAAKVGGAALSGLVQGGGHVYSNSVSAGVSTNNNTVLSIPGLGTLRFDCLAGGVESVPEFLNSSGTSIALMGQAQFREGGTDQTAIDPNNPGIGDNIYVPFEQRSLGSGTFQAWNYAGGGISATINYSSIFCSYNAQATINK